ncbi:putative defense protein Hdd11-like [Saccostrea echinata]|uniref:putative defense protein Hdd11-like n=1 Tax=Saccostrea echinata TaxID=191078 RepID=UPI002A8378F9|nr:putative defense protein Hdd11-like [Saccostrea echinata]
MVRRWFIGASCLFLVLQCVMETNSYSSGAPSMTSVCKQRKPLHHSGAEIIPPQIGNAPVSVTTNVSKAMGGDVITVTVKAEQDNFKGLLVDTVTDIESNEEISSHGEFLASSYIKQVQCSWKHPMVTHSSSSPKQNVTLLFRVPSITAAIRFRVTIVQTYEVYWMNVTSAAISVTPSNSTSSNLSRKWLKSVVQTAKSMKQGTVQLDIRSRFSKGFDGVMNRDNIMASKEILNSLPFIMAESTVKGDHGAEEELQGVSRSIANLLKGNLDYTDKEDLFLE